MSMSSNEIRHSLTPAYAGVTGNQELLELGLFIVFNKIFYTFYTGLYVLHTGCK